MVFFLVNLRNSLLLEECFRIMEQFDSTLSCSLMSIYFCGGSCTPGCHYSFDEPSLASSDNSHL